MMFVPGNNPGMMADAHIYGPDSIMLDLEDSVTMAEKDAARLLVYNALKTIDYGSTEMVVRINPLNTPYGKKDVEAVVKAGVDVIRMPKTETADEVRELEAEILKVETEIGRVGETRIMAAIESALGIVNAYEIATSSKRMMGIALGAEDYSANLKTNRTPGGAELLLAREQIVVAARAAGNGRRRLLRAAQQAVASGVIGVHIDGPGPVKDTDARAVAPVRAHGFKPARAQSQALAALVLQKDLGKVAAGRDRPFQHLCRRIPIKHSFSSS